MLFESHNSKQWRFYFFFDPVTLLKPHREVKKSKIEHQFLKNLMNNIGYWVPVEMLTFHLLTYQIGDKR